MEKGGREKEKSKGYKIGCKGLDREKGGREEIEPEHNKDEER